MQPLKEATKAKHNQAEHMPFNVKMFMGQLSENDYLRYLAQQLAIFKAIESNELPSEALARVSAVEEDIEELVKKGNTATNVLPSTKMYTNYLNNLTSEEILPHVYLNYLALMFGGKIMRTKVPSSGKMYQFENRKEAMLSVREVQKDEWADEVNDAYDYLIAIFEELDEVTK